MRQCSTADTGTESQKATIDAHCSFLTGKSQPVPDDSDADGCTRPGLATGLLIGPQRRAGQLKWVAARNVLEVGASRNMFCSAIAFNPSMFSGAASFNRLEPEAGQSSSPGFLETQVKNK